MSKSKKKQRAREAQIQKDVKTPLAPAASESAAGPLVLDCKLYERIVHTAVSLGVSVPDSGRLTHLYNGETLSIKYVEADCANGRGERVMVAAFRQGIVFQIEDGRLIVQMSGAWVEQLLTGSTASE